MASTRPRSATTTGHVVDGSPDALDVAARATAFLRAHYREAISVRDLAEHLSYSPSHLTRTFTGMVGTSPIGYLSAWRLHEAKRLLLGEDLGAAEVCPTDIGANADAPP